MNVYEVLKRPILTEKTDYQRIITNISLRLIRGRISIRSSRPWKRFLKSKSTRSTR
jgi:hypothetical protein